MGYRGEMEEESAEVHTDWDKLACLLCKRAFPSKEKLIKHNQVSDLHRQNLEEYRRQRGEGGGGQVVGQSDSSLQQQQLQQDQQVCRDRAKERRLKYGEDDEMQKRAAKNKQKYMKAMERQAAAAAGPPVQAVSEKKSIGGDNLGNKMLQRMGWKEGLGLGNDNQGRTSIIEAEKRNAQAGLGTKSASLDPNDSYKDSVKKTLFARYGDFDDN